MVVSCDLKSVFAMSNARSSYSPSPTHSFLTRQIVTESSKDKNVHWLKKFKKLCELLAINLQPSTFQYVLSWLHFNLNKILG